jgi:hypothetical protein
MKNIIEIPVPKAEDRIAANKRMDIYAAKRDIQASEYNSSIAKRLLLIKEEEQGKTEK